MLQILLQDLNGFLHLAPLRFRPFAEFIGRNHLPIPGRGQSETDRRSQDDDALPRGFVTQCGKGFALLGLKGLVNRFPSRLVVFALEHGWQCCFEIVHQLTHCAPEFQRAPGRKLDRNRLVRFAEIIDIDPVGRAGHFLRCLPQDAPHGLLHARPT